MLLQFTFENFRSFRGETTLSLLAAPGIEHPPGMVANVGGTDVLRAAAVYGANGSGKSNLVQAIQFAQHLVSNGTAPGTMNP